MKKKSFGIWDTESRRWVLKIDGKTRFKYDSEFNAISMIAMMQHLGRRSNAGAFIPKKFKK